MTDHPEPGQVVWETLVATDNVDRTPDEQDRMRWESLSDESRAYYGRVEAALGIGPGRVSVDAADLGHVLAEHAAAYLPAKGSAAARLRAEMEEQG